MQKNMPEGDIPNCLSPQMVALWTTYTVEQRATKLGELFQAGRELMLEGIRLRKQGISDAQARLELKKLLYSCYQNSNA